MPSRHLAHTLAPLLLVGSILLLIFATLSPSTVIVNDASISLLRVQRRTSSKRSFVSEIPHFREVRTHLDSRRMAKAINPGVRRTDAPSLTERAPTQHLTIAYGPLGACYSRGSSMASFKCMSSSLTPSFSQMTSSLDLPSNLITILPRHFPLTPTVLVIGLMLMIASLSVSLFSAFINHVSKVCAKFPIEQRKKWARLVVILGGLGIVTVLLDCILWRVQIGHAVSRWSKQTSQGEFDMTIGSGFTFVWTSCGVGLLGLVFASFQVFVKESQ